MKFLMALAVAAMLVGPARASHVPVVHLQYSCETVRWWADHFSEEHLRALAKAAGVRPTKQQEAEARACLAK